MIAALLLACTPPLPELPAGSWPAWTPGAFHAPGQPDRSGPDASCRLIPPDVRTPQGPLRYDRLIVLPDATYAYLPELRLYAAVPVPVDPALQVLRIADAVEGACPTITIEPFADPRYVAATTPAMRYVVDLHEGDARELDALGAYLEGCAMDRRRRRWECGLDLMWGLARIDASGHDTSGTFTPRWEREAARAPAGR